MLCFVNPWYLMTFIQYQNIWENYLEWPLWLVRLPSKQNFNSVKLGMGCAGTTNTTDGCQFKFSDIANHSYTCHTWVPWAQPGTIRSTCTGRATHTAHTALIQLEPRGCEFLDSSSGLFFHRSTGATTSHLSADMLIGCSWDGCLLVNFLPQTTNICRMFTKMGGCHPSKVGFLPVYESMSFFQAGLSSATKKRAQHGPSS